MHAAIEHHIGRGVVQNTLEPGKMRIRVRATSGVATLTAAPQWTVADLKAAIAEQLNVAAADQQCTLGGDFGASTELT